MKSKKINKLGIICGAGELPEKVIEAANKHNISIIIAAIKPFAKKSLISKYNHFWSCPGQIGTIGESFSKANVSHICFAGAVKRPSLLNLKLDSLGKELFIKYFKKVSGDNSLLSIILKTYEEKFGFIVISPQELNPTILATKNFYSVKKPSKEELEDIQIGFATAKKLGELDIGQSLIVQQRIIVAIEGAEGTAALIKRSKKLLKKHGTKGILVKVKKPNQDSRVDLPTIGLKTIKQIKKANLAGIAVENNSTLILNQQEIINYANKHNLFVTTIDNTISKI